jgi:hypothetical protein
VCSASTFAPSTGGTIGFRSALSRQRRHYLRRQGHRLRTGDAMESCYLIGRGVAVMVSEDNSPFKPHTTREQLQFDRPVSRTATDMTFAKDNWLIQVPIENVAYCEWNGQQGRNYWGSEIPTT